MNTQFLSKQSVTKSKKPHKYPIIIHTEGDKKQNNNNEYPIKC